jgi:hypothetical protein
MYPHSLVVTTWYARKSDLNCSFVVLLMDFILWLKMRVGQLETHIYFTAEGMGESCSWHIFTLIIRYTPVSDIDEHSAAC